jgi:hypothetical protein
MSRGLQGLEEHTRSTDSEKLHQNVIAYFSRPIGYIGLFVPDGDSETGVLRQIHLVQNFPGSPGVSRDRMATFCSEGDVSGIDVSRPCLSLAMMAPTYETSQARLGTVVMGPEDVLFILHYH